jgi:hypothetical protein
MNVEIGTEAAQFPEKEYIIGIFVAVQCPLIRKIMAGPLTKDEKIIKFYSFFSWAKTVPVHFQSGRTSSGWKARLQHELQRRLLSATAVVAFEQLSHTKEVAVATSNSKDRFGHSLGKEATTDTGRR